ncbi:hypothetical protein DFH08DRAFT_816229 [Mycena albidolilacea]|uniref:Uncharacterized protein n=1 Tax=Mycena albidolilacea TaxID=1033008 RepID=A0AAD6ZM40_9AGAR|nr:hypothetical protein DFH08DRAFT_816229 [Mycena albidolilacea]
MDDDNAQPPVRTLDRSARQWGFREWGFRWDKASAASTSCAEPSISTPSPAGYSQAKRDVLQLPPAVVARFDLERGAHVVHSGGCFPAIRGGPLPFGWRFAQKCCVLEMHAIFTSKPGAGRCAHYITRRGAAAPNYVLEYMYCILALEQATSIISVFNCSLRVGYMIITSTVKPEMDSELPS